MTVNHKNQCIASTAGFFGSNNDKTIIRFDPFVYDIMDRDIYTQKQFTLYDANGNSNIHRGVYLLCDNGYHRWRCLQCPLKVTYDHNGLYYLKWSKRIESLRKDVECFFGALKMRFYLLNGNIRVQNEELVDNIFLTCCALHNQLLLLDKMDDWHLGIPPLYQIPIGTTTEIPIEDDDDEETNDARFGAEQIHDQDEVNYIALMQSELEVEDFPSHYTLRDQLVTHFSYLYDRNEIYWPTRYGFDSVH